MPTESKVSYMWNDQKLVALYRSGEKLTRPHAKHLIEQSRVAYCKEIPLVIFDNACGTGVISSLLHEIVDERCEKQLGTDLRRHIGGDDPAMVGCTKGRIEEEGRKNAEAQVVDAQQTGLPSAHFTHIFIAMAIFSFPDPGAALDECLRMLKPGGTIAFSTWKEPGWMRDIGAAVATMPGNLPFPSLQELSAAVGKGQWHHESWEKIEQHDFENIQVSVVPETIPRC
ncbi:hypothetical protein VTN00DRAFT_134 [Thermoascus crustaceus]|uniref:uncharacterized protein n=1 Tax=Thermoascus crustaceus TaxID=5088 RepID=UPI003744AF2F